MKYNSKLTSIILLVCDLSHRVKIIYTFLLLIYIAGCSGGPTNSGNDEEQTLKVAVAANVQFAIKEIEVAFEKSANKDIDIIIGSSGKLTAQIQQGAPYDLLLAANMKYPQSLYQSGHAATEPTVYGLGALVLWTLKTDLVLDEKLAILQEPIVQKIAIANPKNAPYGEEAIKVFDYFKIKNQVEPKLVFAESIAQTNQYILTKNCEVGLTAKSVVLSPKMKGKGTWIEVPEVAYQPINQGVVVTKYGTENHPALAQQFYDFLFSKTSKEILEKYGYTTFK